MAGTKERIVSEARRLFAERGYRGATTSEIARAAGISEASIYRHFSDKKELFLACVEPAVTATLNQAMDFPAATDLRDLIRQRLAARVLLIREHLDAFNILFSEAAHDPELAEMLFERVLLPRTDKSLPGVHQALAGWLPRMPNPLILGVGLTAAIWSILNVGPRGNALFRAWPQPVHPEQLIDDLTDFVLFGIAGEPTSPGPARPHGSPEE